MSGELLWAWIWVVSLLVVTGGALAWDARKRRNEWVHKRERAMRRWDEILGERK